MCKLKLFLCRAGNHARTIIKRASFQKDIECCLNSNMNEVEMRVQL